MVIKYDRGPVLARIAEIEVVLRSPATPRQLERVVELALEVAEKLPAGVLAGLAFQVANAARLSERFPQEAEPLLALHVALRQLRAGVAGAVPPPPG